MPDYSKGKIYKIVCNTTGLVYIGSTCEPTLARRLAKHRTDYNRYLNGKIRNITSLKLIENNNYEIVLVENYNCASKDELHARERFYIESIECVNKVIPTRNKKEYYDDNKVQLIDYQHNYNSENYEAIKVKNLQYYHDNKEKKLEYQKQYNITNKAKKSSYQKEYRMKKKSQ
jgi:hypothetical protein